MAPQAPSLLSPSELSYLHTSLSLQPPIRPDARALTSFRPLVAEIDLLPSANGSARLCFADGTEAIVGVKAEVEKESTALHNVEIRGEDADMKDVEHEGGHGSEGDDRWIEVIVDVPGQRDDDTMVAFLAQMIREGLLADGVLRARLVINARWHWRLYVDVGIHCVLIALKALADPPIYIDPPPITTSHLPSPSPFSDNPPCPSLHPPPRPHLLSQRGSHLQRRLGCFSPPLLITNQ